MIFFRISSFYIFKQMKKIIIALKLTIILNCNYKFKRPMYLPFSYWQFPNFKLGHFRMVFSANLYELSETTFLIELSLVIWKLDIFSYEKEGVKKSRLI